MLLEQICLTRKNILIAGDLNSNVLRGSKDDKGKKLSSILETFSLKNIITKPTRVTETTKTLIDLIIVKDKNKISCSGVLDVSIADHKLIYAVYNLKRKKSPPKTIMVRDFKKLDTSAFKKDVRDAPWWVCATFEEVDDVTWCWQTMYKNIADEHLKKRKAKVRADSLPWVDRNIRKMMNRRFKLLKKCDGTEKTSLQWQEYRKVRNLVTKSLKEAEANYWRKKFEEVSSSKDFWKTFHKITNNKVRGKIGPLRANNGELITDDKQKADLMNNFFINVGKNLAEKFPQMIENSNEYIYRISPTISSLIIDEEKLRKQIRKINPKKAAGPDDITSKELSILQDDVMEGIKVVFNKSIACNQYPSIWKLAKVKSAFKNGEKIESPNYRPLSMLSIPGKLFEGQACDNIDKHVTIHNLLSKNQWGFNKGRSTEELLLQITEKWKNAMDKGLIVGAIFLDFQKAFDSVSHDILGQKLQAVGISGDLYSWIVSYLRRRKQYTEINGKSSVEEEVLFGVPQGSLLGPKLYTILVNDLPEAITEGEVTLFADDTSIYCIGDNVDKIIDSLNLAMEGVLGWCRRNKLTVHPGKTEAMLLMKRAFMGPLKAIKYGESYISIVDSVKYLGITIDNKLTWDKHISTTCKKFSSKLGALKRMKFLPTNVLEEIYYKTVISGITYCISVWGNCSIALFQKLETIHSRAARQIFNLPTGYPDDVSLTHAKWQPLSCIYKRSIIKWMHKIYFNKADQSLQDLFENNLQQNYAVRDPFTFKIPRYKKEIGRNSLQYRGPFIWNMIPSDIKSIVNKDKFKEKLKTLNDFIKNFSFRREAILISKKDPDFYY